MLPLVVLLGCLVVAATRGAGAQLSPRVQALLAEMTVEEKVGEMTQLNIDLVWNTVSKSVDLDQVRYYAQTYKIGSWLNSPHSGGLAQALNATEWFKLVSDIQGVYVELGLVPMIYGVDSVHGFIYLHGGTVFPQQINAAASFDPSVAEQLGHITAYETRAVGIPWTFAPILDLATHPGWPRVYETFGEDPKLSSVMADAIVRGYQGSNVPASLADPDRVAACMKHFIGYGNPRNGQDRSTSIIPDRHLRQYYLPSFQAAIDAGVATAMESYNDINGEPVVASHKYLKQILREEMGFGGMLVTDWAEINDLVAFHRIKSTKKEATQLGTEEHVAFL